MESSLLEKVASHESDLMAGVSTSEAEARDIVEAAQTEAAAELAEALRKLEADLAELRRNGLAERNGEQARIEAAAVEKVRQIRERSENKRSEIISEMFDLLVPAEHGSASPPASE